MIFIFMASFLVHSASTFRGPHHPKSSISHHHHVPKLETKLTQDQELLHDVSHLKEDLGSIGADLDISNMSAEELEFHYFNLHDFNNDTKLDGLELLHALQHAIHEHEEEMSAENALYSGDGTDDHFSSIVEIIDRVLLEDDIDGDGFLSYSEFVSNRRKSESKDLWSNQNNKGIGNVHEEN
ncbi:hypothetical protein QAD02_001102 [Eretmocerus hayati]|uniref:Uncharacterized protein n=1 Tax=Eretmocerus hayati TaxID=131215 RepID=A0ACC2NGD9_9HYME|nr:hypothetical protein QAD02_001102 [Eretmocerus hayati]